MSDERKMESSVIKRRTMRAIADSETSATSEAKRRRVKGRKKGKGAAVAVRSSVKVPLVGQQEIGGRILDDIKAVKRERRSVALIVGGAYKGREKQAERQISPSIQVFGHVLIAPDLVRMRYSLSVREKASNEVRLSSMPIVAQARHAHTSLAELLERTKE